MYVLSASDVSIAIAAKSGTLRLSSHVSERLGNTYVAISDETGLIEISMTMTEARAIVARAVAASNRRVAA